MRKERAAPQGPARAALAGWFPAPAIGLPLTAGLAFWDDFAWAGQVSGGGGGGITSVNGDTGPTVVLDAADVGADPTGTAASAITTHVGLTDPHTQYQRESEKGSANGYASLDASTLVPVAQLPVATTSAYGAAKLAASGGTTSGTVVQATDSRLSDSRTPTAHKSTHATGGSDALAPSDIGAQATSQKGSANGYCGLDASALVSPTNLPLATDSARGVGELGTYLEGHTASEVRLPDMRDWWNVFNVPSPFTGAWWPNMIAGGTNASGTGTLSQLSITAGTFNKTLSTTYGPHLSVAQSSTAGSERSVYMTLSGNSLTFDQCKYMRNLVWLGAGTVSTSRVLFGWALAAGTATTPATTTRHFACGLWEGAFHLRAADGTTAATPVAFTATPSDGVIYAMDVIPASSGTSITVNLYSWNWASGLTFVEAKTISSNIPTGSTNPVPFVVARSASGTPNALFGGWLMTVNKTAM